MKKITLPLTQSILNDLKSGDLVSLSGTIYTARDAAHQRLKTLYEANEKLPIDLNNQIIYYAGPTPTKPNDIIGAIGPTTSSRMDFFLPFVYQLGVIATIGKGNRSLNAKELCKSKKRIYFIATGGIGALLKQCIVDSQVVAFEDLGCESIKKLTIKDFPVYVAYDIHGNDIFEENENELKR